MDLIIIAFFFTAFIVGIMAVSLYFGRPPIKGTCGGLNQLMGNQDCQFCSGDTEACESRSGDLQSFKPSTGSQPSSHRVDHD